MTTTELDRVSVLLRTYLFEDLSPAEVEPLARQATVPRAVRGEHIWQVGDPADQICVVASGQLKGFRVPGSRFRRIPRDALYRFIEAEGRRAG